MVGVDVKLFFDQTEDREGTRLPQSIIQAGIKLQGLEDFTGADLLISVHDGPPLTRLTDAPPCQAIFRRYCEQGALVQRKASRDFTSSIPKLDSIQAKMIQWGAQIWLMVIGVITADGYGRAIIDGQVTGFQYNNVLGALNYWQVRGGSWINLCNDGQIGPWINLVGNMLSDISKHESKMLMPKKSKQYIGFISDENDEGIWRRKCAEVMLGFNGIGPKLAQDIAIRCGTLAEAICYLSDSELLHKARKGKGDLLSGIGVKTLEGIRYQMGLSDEMCGLDLKYCNQTEETSG